MVDAESLKLPTSRTKMELSKETKREGQGSLASD